MLSYHTTTDATDDYELTLTSWLFRESRRHRKQRKTIRQLHSDLVQLGYTGSYDRVQDVFRGSAAERNNHSDLRNAISASLSACVRPT